MKGVREGIWRGTTNTEGYLRGHMENFHRGSLLNKYTYVKEI